MTICQNVTAAKKQPQFSLSIKHKSCAERLKAHKHFILSQILQPSVTDMHINDTTPIPPLACNFVIVRGKTLEDYLEVFLD